MKFAWLGVLLALWTAGGSAQTPPPENTGPNKNIIRWAEGAYLYRTIDGSRERGTERFRLTVHPDGTRTMTMSNDMFARNGQLTVVLRAAADFRPLSAYVSYWTAAGYKGQALIDVQGDRLELLSLGPAGRHTQSIAAPQKLSLATQPISADGWHMWYADAAAKGPQTDGRVFALDAGADLSRPILGQLRPFGFEAVGREKVTVPAGTFDAIKYRTDSLGELWVATEDRILVRTLHTERGNEYVLTEYKSGSVK
jgi:hypothetical protein